MKKLYFNKLSEDQCCLSTDARCKCDSEEGIPFMSTLHFEYTYKYRVEYYSSQYYYSKKPVISNYIGNQFFVTQEYKLYYEAL